MTTEERNALRERVNAALPTLGFDPGAVWYQMPRVFDLCDRYEEALERITTMSMSQYLSLADLAKDAKNTAFLALQVKKDTQD